MAYRKNGTPLNFKGSLKKATKTSAGYLWTRVTKNGASTNLLIHVMVATAFIPNPDDLPEVNHKDLDPLNCVEGNLEWVTHQQNIAHARDGGRMSGYTNPKKRLKLDPERVADIRLSLSRGETQQSIADRHGVNRRYVGLIGQNQRWNDRFIDGAPNAAQ